MSHPHRSSAVAAGLLAAGVLTAGLLAAPARADVAAPAPQVAGATVSLPAPLRGTTAPGVLAGRYVVVLKTGATAAGTDAAVDLARDAGAVVTRTYGESLPGYAATMTPAGLAEVRSDPAVAYVEADRRITVQGSRSSASWGQDRIDQRSGLNGRIVTAGDGGGTTVYVVDTGIRSTHQDLAGRVAAGFSAVSDGNGTQDCNGHGTHVAGTVGSAKYGVAPGTTLVPVRVLDCDGGGSSSAVIAGIDWVTAHHAPNSVANLSLGGSGFTALDNAVKNSIAAGVTYTVAAGNSTRDACQESPSRLPQAITVAASTQSDGVASFSNFGSCVDLYAPGQYIVSTVSSSDTATASYSGTSMAAPHAAGAAALYLQAHPGSSPAQVSAALIADSTPDALTGVPAGTPNKLLYLGDTTDLTTAPTTAPTTPATPTPAPSSPSTTKPTTKPRPAPAYCRTLRAKGTITAKDVVVAGKSFRTGRRGTQYGCLTGPRKANFDLVLDRWSGKKWARVARGHTTSATESVAYTGAAGKYRWKVVAVKGAGTYSLRISYPS